ncbi:ATP-binding cassette subfamily B multidrug efflux pump [Actimicrobium sp. GrIS 1.19]|uniref:ABC transporter ATP-binding protein n=1 Tax=Actimicrobium sp. GrIS 1.19 TaxID=3071708 RepID=UPI002DF8666A|nr:ATP-binding cassette subfamily B multidrug efflux pump [Actimicrobium sp. GrIS 1.19]
MRSETLQAIDLLRHSAAPDRKHLWLGVLWLVVAAGLEVLGPLMGKVLIDDHLLPRHLDWPRMIGLLAAFLVSGWIASALRYLQLVRLSGLAMRSVRRLRESVYNHVLRLPMTFFDTAITGKLVSRVTNDTEAVKNLYIQVLFVMLDSSIVVTGAMLAMAWLDWRLMLIVLGLFPTVVVIVWFYQRMSAPAVARARELRSEINAQMAESIGGMTVLQASNATARFSQRFLRTNQLHYAARVTELRANAWLLRPALDFLNILLLVGVIYSFGQRQFSALEVGILYAFVSYIARVVDPLIQITLQFSQLQQSVVAAARVNTLLHESRPQRNVSDLHIGAGAVSIRNLRFGYRPDQIVLHDLSLDIPAGAFYGVVGHTGSGKSTLLSLLLRFYTASAGRIDIDGMALATIGDDAFRADVGLVPQDPFLLAASARENIDMGRGYSQAQIETAARAAKAHGFISALEQGYDTPLGEGGARLSTGQKQLIAIARALAGQPKILFLDEATSHIDSETEQVVQAALNELRGSVTIIAIAHRLSTIRDADRIIVLNHGQIAESGAHEALMAIEDGIYQKLYLLQQLGD